MISPQVVTILRKRTTKRTRTAPLSVPPDCAFEWRWLGRAEIAAFAIIALLMIRPLIDAAIAVRLLP